MTLPCPCFWLVWYICLGYTNNSTLYTLGSFPENDGPYLVFEGNHRLAALLLLKDYVVGQHPGDYSGQALEWQSMNLQVAEDADGNGDADPIISISIFKPTMPVSIMIMLAACKLYIPQGGREGDLV